MDNAIVKREKLSKTLLEKNEAVFSYDIHYPVIEWESQRIADYVNGYSKNIAEELLKKLKKERKTGKEKTDALIFWRRFDVSYNKNDLFSIVCREHSRAGYNAPDHVRLSADNWNLRKGNYLTLSSLFVGGSGYRRIILTSIVMQISDSIKREGKHYYDRYPALVRDGFNPVQFYLTEEGLGIFYQPGVISSENDGPHIFIIPYKVLGGRMKLKL